MFSVNLLWQDLGEIVLHYFHDVGLAMEVDLVRKKKYLLQQPAKRLFKEETFDFLFCLTGLLDWYWRVLQIRLGPPSETFEGLLKQDVVTGRMSSTKSAKALRVDE